MDSAPPRACSDALKLFRVMACQSQSLAAHLEDTYNIIKPIQRFIAGLVAILLVFNISTCSHQELGEICFKFELYSSLDLIFTSYP